MAAPQMAGLGMGDSGRLVPGPGPASGIITRTRTFAALGGLPARLHLAVADLADRSRDLPWQSDRQAFGTSWHGPAEARRRAEAEAFERHCGAVPPAADQLRYGSYEELVGSGTRALDPRRLVLYSPRQYVRPDFPFVPFRPDSPAHWIRGHSHPSGEPVLVPAFLVFTGWRRMSGTDGEPRYAFPAVGGIAAGATMQQALLSGLGEVIERDTAARWWAAARALPALPLTEELRALTAGARFRHGTRVLHLPNEFGVPVLAAGVFDSDRGWLTYGFAARADAHEAAAKALAEAYTLHLTCRTLDDPAAVPRTPGRPSPLKPWRHDRRYLDSYRPDHRDVVEQLCHQQLYLDRRAAERVAPWAWELPAGSWDDVPSGPPHEPAGLVDRVTAAGYEVISVDLTTDEAAAAGLRVIRVVVPGTVPAAPAAYPPLGGDRLRTAARQGREGAEPDEEHLNLFPLPHS